MLHRKIINVPKANTVEYYIPMKMNDLQLCTIWMITINTMLKEDVRLNK